MRIGLPVLLGFLSAATADAQNRVFVYLHGGGKLYAETVGTQTRFNFGASPHTVTVRRDEQIEPTAPVQDLQVIAETKTFLIVKDTYQSRLASMHYCQNGSEEFLRVIRLGAHRKETMRLKLSSCRENIDPADPGVTWNGREQILSIRWLSFGGEHDRRVNYRIREGGIAELT